MSRLAAVWRDRRGATAVEFAIIAPALLTVLLGVFDISYNLYTASVLEGVMQKAGRDSSIEGAETKGLAIDDRVRSAVHDVMPNATVTFQRQAYLDYSDIHRPEDFNDMSKDGVCNNGEPFEDVNGNGRWDSDRGRDAMGGARDAVLYTASASYPRAFPLMKLIGFSPIVTAQVQTVLRNQPYGPQNRTAAVGQCA